MSYILSPHCRLCNKKFEIDDEVIYCHVATADKMPQEWKSSNKGRLCARMSRKNDSSFAYHQRCFLLDPSRVIDTCAVCGKSDTPDNPLVYGPNILLHYDCEKIWAKG